MNRDDSFDVFVSSSAEDRLFADALVEGRGREGIRYWITPESIPAGLATTFICTKPSRRR